MKVVAGTPMKPLFYLFFPSGFSGVARYTHEVLTHLARVPGVQPELACPPSYHWREDAAYAVWPGLKELSHPWPLRRRARFFAAQFVSPFRLIEHARSIRPDVIHLSNINQLTHPLWRTAMAKLGIPVVATVHDVARERGIINAAYENAQLRAFYRSADALLVHGRHQAEQLERAGVNPERVHVVPHGPYSMGKPGGDRAGIRRQWGLPTEKRVCIFFGSVRSNKNLDVLLRAMKAASGDFHLVVAGQMPKGKPKDAAYYARLIEELGLRERVTVIDRRIADGEAADLFSASDFNALPYGRTFTSQSGVLSVAAEYGTPVVASNVGAMGEALTRHDIGVVVEPDDVESLRAGLESMLARLEVGHAHRFSEFARHHSWEANASKTVAVYQALTGHVAEARGSVCAGCA